VLQGRPTTGKTIWIRKHGFLFARIIKTLFNKRNYYEKFDRLAVLPQMCPFSMRLESEKDLDTLLGLVATDQVSQAIEHRGARIIIETNMDLNCILSSHHNISQRHLDMFTFWSGPSDVA
jgi:hypothetical protein